MLRNDVSGFETPAGPETDSSSLSLRNHLVPQALFQESTSPRPMLSRNNSSYLDSTSASSIVRSSTRTSSIGSTTSSFLDDIKHEVMVNYLYQQQCSRLWVSDGSGELEGVLLRKARHSYLTCPPALADSELATMCAELNVQVAMTVNSRVIKTFLDWSPEAVDVPLMNGLRVQILLNIRDLAKARKHQFAALIAIEALLVVWDDEASNIMRRARAIESELMQLVWQTGLPGADGEIFDDKPSAYAGSDIEAESTQVLSEQRPTHLMNTVLVAFTLVIVVTLLGLGCRSVAIEIAVDKIYLRLAFLALIPVQIFFTLVSRSSSLILRI